MTKNDPPARVDHEIAAELTDVGIRRPGAIPSRQKGGVLQDHLRPEQGPPIGGAEPKRLVRFARRVRDDRESPAVGVDVRRKPLGRLERDHHNLAPRPRLDDRGISALHLDEVRLAGESGEVSKENQDRRSMDQLGKPDRRPLGVREDKVRCAITRVQHDSILGWE